MFRCFTAVVAATVVSSFCTALVAQSIHAADQQVVVALAEIEKEGGTIDVEKADGKEVSSLKAARDKVKDEEVKALQFRDLRGLQAALEETAKLKDVKHIGINFCWSGPRTLSEAELEKLAAVESLEKLTFTDTVMDSKSIAKLAKLPNLKTIEFSELTSRNFKDAHLEGVSKLTTVTTVDISRVRTVSPEALAAFQKNRPDCQLIAAKQKPKS